MRRPRLPAVVVAFLCAGVASGAVAVPAASAAPTIAAAGDIACPPPPCASQRSTAGIIRRLDPDAVLTLGDNQYPTGSLTAYLNSYALTWGAFLRITHPVPGNHDYSPDQAVGYFKYFGARAHRGSGGHYSFNLGGWHLVALNSERPSSAQSTWLRRDLRRDRHRCELAYWHEPRWSSGREHGGTTDVAGWWRTLYQAGVDVVLNGHEHNYERFARLSPSGNETRRGIREFVVGTGGYELYRFGNRVHGSERRIVAHGVLSMALRRTGYDWRFVKVGGGTGDRGHTACHR
jgi:Calcineurin-like phosphoesterase